MLRVAQRAGALALGDSGMRVAWDGALLTDRAPPARWAEELRAVGAAVLVCSTCATDGSAASRFAAASLIDTAKPRSAAA
jgi:hypothetical protein